MPAKKGNKYALGNSGGRPRIWESAGELEIFIGEYFEDIDRRPIYVWAKQLDREGNPVRLEQKRPYTVEGVCLHLGVSRQTFLNYGSVKGYEEFFDVIQRAKQRIIDQRVTYGMSGVFDSNFTRFTLMNMAGMSEKGENTNTNTNYNTEPMTPERAKEISKKLEDEV